MSLILLRRSLFGMAFCLALPWMAVAASLELPSPNQDDTCPVCGMFVAKYPAWIATVQYRDGHLHHFDGAKDLFKYLLNMPKWAPGHRREDILAIGVTEYYTLSRIDLQSAYFVTGSDVLGPMGHELIPLETEADAREFSQDHKGVRILQQDEVTLELLDALDKGQFQ